MIVANAHNLTSSLRATGELRFGIRVSLPDGDPLQAVLGRDWQAFHWYATAAERNEAMSGMALRHPYNRSGDRPTIQLEPVDR